MIGIYILKNIITGFVYVGQSIHIAKRWQEHLQALNKNEHHNLYLQNAWNKYGKENFKFEVLETINTIEHDLLNLKETYWYNYYKPKVYNLGHTGNIKTMSEETKYKISKSINKNLANLSDKDKKLKFGRSGEASPNFNKPKSKEVKDKISKSLLGRESYIRTRSTIEKQKSSSKNQWKAVKLINLKTNLEYKFNCISEACRRLNLDQAAVSLCCMHKRKTTKGYICEYLDNTV